MPVTAIQHFRDDLQRARLMLGLTSTIPPDRLLKADLRRSAWMFGVGALDAYFCDAYSDLVAATMIAQQQQTSPKVELPDFFQQIRLPVKAVLSHYEHRQNWRWRMAARGLMTRENVLHLDKIRHLFNPFLKAAGAARFFDDALLTEWISKLDTAKRIFGISPLAFAVKKHFGLDIHDDLKLAKEQLDERFRTIFQRRHDCIHNCDRPKSQPQKLERDGTVIKVLDDVSFLVEGCDAHLTAGFRLFLVNIGCLPATISSVGY